MNDNSQHNRCPVWTSQNYIYIFCQMDKNVFFGVAQNFSNSSRVPWDEKGWKSLFQESPLDFFPISQIIVLGAIELKYLKVLLCMILSQTFL